MISFRYEHRFMPGRYDTSMAVSDNVTGLFAFKLSQLLVINGGRNSQQLKFNSDANPKNLNNQGPYASFSQSGKRQAFFFPVPAQIPGFLKPVDSTSSSFASIPLSGNPNKMDPNNQLGNIPHGSSVTGGGLPNIMIPNQQSGQIHSGPNQNPPFLLNQGTHLTNGNGGRTSTSAAGFFISPSTGSTTVTTVTTSPIPLTTSVDSCAIAATICHLKCPTGYFVDRDDCTVCVCTRDIFPG
ncbi:hypothetical protein ACJMK2_025394 [Sinanodonta woodiana]|uniref:Antistasin-like domain-containing protein n=1 Tax=Sinanodonta woodiana TaxID=1069815 RepID=A0ABD3XIR5_SINWO